MRGNFNWEKLEQVTRGLIPNLKTDFNYQLISKTLKILGVTVPGHAPPRAPSRGRVSLPPLPPPRPVPALNETGNLV